MRRNVHDARCNFIFIAGDLTINWKETMKVDEILCVVGVRLGIFFTLASSDWSYVSSLYSYVHIIANMAIRENVWVCK